MTKEIARTNEISANEKPLTAVEVKAQVNIIQEVMRAVMHEGQHYGIIPGAGNKPTLLKAGAEKIMSIFRLAADPEVIDLSVGDIIHYRVKLNLISPSGRIVGSGIGECSSEEDKYKWRIAVSDAEYEATPETHRRIKFRKDGEIKQVRTNPYDLANTILKMAKKRSLVDAVLTTTAASDIFTQDIEDIPEEIVPEIEPSQPIRPPQPKIITQTKNIDLATESQLKAIHTMLDKLGITSEEKYFYISNALKLPNIIESSKQLTKLQARQLIEYLNQKLQEK